jgi:hypothetical protein
MGEKLAVTPDGAPVDDSAMFPLNPPLTETWTAACLLEDCVSDTEAGAVSWKAGTGIEPSVQ